MSRPNPTGHPARYSEAIVDLLAEIVLAEYPEWLGRPSIVDPCAGTGEALRDFQRLTVERDRPYNIGFEVHGIEIEPVWIVDDIVRQGDATDISCYPDSPVGRLVVMTSPVYPNGVADNFIPQDDSTRFTYISKAIRRIDDPTFRLHPNDQANFGYRGTKRGGASKRRAEYWRLAHEMVAVWAKVAELVLLNISDFKHSNGEIEPVVMDWRRVLAEHGFTDQVEIPVGTPRMRNGANADQRVDVEVIVKARRG
jgi:hypothetical protein